MKEFREQGRQRETKTNSLENSGKKGEQEVAPENSPHPEQSCTGRMCLSWNSEVCWMLPASKGGFNTLRLISINFKYIHPQPAIHLFFGAACTQFAGSRLVRKEPLLQILGICALTADCCSWSQRQQPLCKPHPPPTAEVTSTAGALSPFYFSLLPILGTTY